MNMSIMTITLCFLTGFSLFNTLFSFQHANRIGSNLLKSSLSQPHKCKSRKVKISMDSLGDDTFELYGDELENSDFLKTLLTFQSIKTFMYYCEELREDVIKQWIAKFDESMKEKEETEGKIQWDQYVEFLMRTEPEEISIQKIGQRARGGRGRNNYLENVANSGSSSQEESTVNPYLTESVYEFKILVDPFSLAKRILSVREQIAKEWSEDLKLISMANEELLRFHYDRTIMGEEEARKGEKLVFEMEPLGTNTPYRTESYQKLTEMITTIAMRRFEKEIKSSNNQQAGRWFDFMKAQTSEMGPDAALKCILKGPSEEEGKLSADEKLEQAMSSERLARILMTMREHAADENMVYLEETSNDHNQILTRFLNERLKDEMNVVDLLEYEYRKSSSHEKTKIQKTENSEEN